jgi:hypothetical protein
MAHGGGCCPAIFGELFTSAGTSRKDVEELAMLRVGYMERSQLEYVVDLWSVVGIYLIEFGILLNIFLSEY